MDPKDSVIMRLTCIQKAQGTYTCVLEGADVGVMWANVMKETQELNLDG